MTQQIPIHSDQTVDFAESQDGLQLIADDLAYHCHSISNVVFAGQPDVGETGWALIDAGIATSGSSIINHAEKRFGEYSRPAAIILTHAHFDHVGGLEEIADWWDVPIFAHPLEFPYLTGSECYPPANPGAGGGLMTLLSPLFPRKPVDVRKWLQPVPPDGTVPGMPGWHWVATPGHTPGHLSLWREADRSLIVGDAFITTAQESAYAVLTRKPEIHGPPKYFTHDWPTARESVRKLAELEPELVISGHGPAMRGEEMRAALRALAEHFDEVAVPDDA